MDLSFKCVYLLTINLVLPRIRKINEYSDDKSFIMAVAIKDTKEGIKEIRGRISVLLTAIYHGVR